METVKRNSKKSEGKRVELRLETPLAALPGIGEAKNALFASRGILTVGDLLSYLPRTYEYRGDIVRLCDCTDGEKHAVEVVCTRAPSVGRTGSGLTFFRMYAQDDTASVVATFFNRRFLLPQIRVGRRYRLYGHIVMGLCGAETNAPEIELITEGKPLPAIVPVYTTSGKLTQNMIRKAVLACLPLCERMQETLPQDLRETYGLLPRGFAVRCLHLPPDAETLQKARHTAAFTELLTFRLALHCMRRAKDGSIAPVLTKQCRDSFLSSLPFALTGAQERAIREISADLSKDVPMTRLVQGDVGSGKTVVAAAALELCVQNGMQGVLIAPTEILAKQHMQKLSEWFAPYGVRTALLTSGVPKKEKTQIKAQLQNGEIDLLIGTHAVLQEDVCFASLGLVVTDEQHRFGVRQRAMLLDRGEENGKRPHMLVMSATPIPRSLSLILYGDLDVTLLDELPPGRQKIETMVLLPKDRARIYASVRRQIAQGGQAYIICPLVEENAESPKKAAESYFDELRQGAFSDVPIGLIHGRMSPTQKAETMAHFADGTLKILVSTTVIEVGVDVPNANVMLIENAECFGLSQLHQLRGRIGRGTRKSFCVLINGGDAPCERLDIMKRSCDGFEIAEADLQQRGPGDFFGDAQSGELVFRTASLTDMQLLAQTAQAMNDVLPRRNDPDYQQLFAAAVRTVRQAGSGKTLN